MQFQLESAHCCSHPIHPGTSQGVPNLCPCCHVSDLLKALKKCTNQWQVYGGPDPQNAEIYYSYTSYRKLWHTRKLELIQYMYNLEVWAEEEVAWVAENPNLVQALGEEWSNVQTSEAALAVAKTEMPFSNTLATDLIPKGPPLQKKSVRFTEDAAT